MSVVINNSAYYLERKKIQIEKGKDILIKKQKEELLKLSKELIRISNENSELRKKISLNYNIEMRLNEAELEVEKLREENNELVLQIKSLESDMNKKMDKVLLQSQYDKLRMEKHRTLYSQKLDVVSQIEKDNEVYRDEVQKLKRKIEEMKGENISKEKELEVVNILKYTKLKKLLMENLNETKNKIFKINAKFSENVDIAEILKNHKLLIELFEEQNKQYDILAKSYDNILKESFCLKNDLDIQKKLSKKLVQKTKNSKDELDYTKTKPQKKSINENSRTSSSLTSRQYQNKKNNSLTIIKQRLNRIQQIKSKNKKNINNSIGGGSSNQMSPSATKSFFSYRHIHKRPGEEYIDIYKDNATLNFKNEMLKLKISEYENKYEGLFNFLEESLDSFYSDIKIMMKNKTVNMELEKIKNFNFNEFSKEEQYGILVLLMRYLLPVIYTNFNSNCDVGKRNIFKTNLNLNIINRNFNKTFNYLNDKTLRKAFLGRNNKLCVELYMDKGAKRHVNSSVPVLKGNKSSEILFDKKSKLLI